MSQGLGATLKGAEGGRVRRSPGLLRSSGNEGRDSELRGHQARHGGARSCSRLQTDRPTGARLRVQAASPGADGSEAFRSLPEGVLCCLEVTGERVAGRGADGHCAGGGMDRGGRRTHLLADPGLRREAWHPASAPERTVMDRRTLRNLSRCSRQALRPSQPQGTRDSSSLDPHAGRRPPAGMSAAGVSCPTRSQKKRPQPLSLGAGCDEVGALGGRAQACDHRGSLAGGRASPGHPAGDPGRRRLGMVLVSFARWAGGPGHPDL